MDRSIGLNLARAWRPRTLSEIIGQRVAVSLLENSLRRGLFFPVYLFAGLRGTGKTSAGRIFAAALNCEKLSAFQQNNLATVPCRECQSCRSMATGAHPDFIEIDAASHTGVDQARQIIEEAAFLPVLGQRKVYLIDEAHMLSKASFNAFLKMLEEPPASVVFLLATTDPHKIIETVRSRCFQLFFDPVKSDDLVPHLETVCTAEKIAYDVDALTLIALESDGSVRDALNLVERLRCTSEKITTDAFFSILGCPDDQGLIALFEIIHTGDAHALFTAIRDRNFSKFEPTIVWERLIELVRALLWAHQGVSFGLFQAHFQEVRRVASLFTFEQIIDFLDLIFRYENQFGKTTARHALIERFLYACVQRCSSPEKQAVETTKKSTPSTMTAVAPQRTSHGIPAEKQTASFSKTPSEKIDQSMEESPWQKVLSLLGNNRDPMLISVLRQGEFVSFTDLVLRVRFPKKFVFYQELLVNNRTVWQPIVEQVFGANTLLVPDFSGEQVTETRPTPQTRESESPTRNNPVSNIDLSDSTRWPLTKTLLDVFPGKITITEDTSHEQNS